jgi:hypothetical protein
MTGVAKSTRTIPDTEELMIEWARFKVSHQGEANQAPGWIVSGGFNSQRHLEEIAYTRPLLQVQACLILQSLEATAVWKGTEVQGLWAVPWYCLCPPSGWQYTHFTLCYWPSRV